MFTEGSPRVSPSGAGWQVSRVSRTLEREENRKQKRIRSKAIEGGELQKREGAKTAPWHQGTEREREEMIEHTSL